MSRNGNTQICTARGKILMLDDESCVRGLLARWLTAAGYECIEARDASEAWGLMRQQDFDLITVDIRMPAESGLDLVHQIKREFPDTVILMVTGVEVALQAVQALTRGAFGYLIKPIDRENLLYHVRTGLAQRQRQIEDREYLRWLEESNPLVARHGVAKTSTRPHTSSNLRQAQWVSN